MITPRRILSAFLFVAASSTLSYADEAVSLKIGYMQMSPDGEIAVEDEGVSTLVDIEGDLDIENSDNITAEAAFSFGDMKLSVGYMPLSFAGDSYLSRSIYFNGQRYNFGDRVQSSVDMDIIDVGLTYYIINMDDVPTRVQVGVEFAVKVTDASASITDTTFDINESGEANRSLTYNRHPWTHRSFRLCCNKRQGRLPGLRRQPFPRCRRTSGIFSHPPCRYICRLQISRYCS